MRGTSIQLASMAAVLVTAGLLAASDPPSDGSLATPILVFPSSVGEVVFPHEGHYDSLEIDCQTCHHETNAKMLDIPHVEYFQDFWIDCTTCHHPSSTPQEARSCSSCHHCPMNCADETLSAKVVIHENCWRCHDVGTGQEASDACSFCHAGPQLAW